MDQTSNDTQNTPVSDWSRAELVEFVHDMQGELMDLRENWDDAGASMLRLRNEDQGWRLWGSIQNDDVEGFSLEITQEIAKVVSKQSAGNPLLVQGFRLRHGNVWGKGISIDGMIRPRVQRKLDLNSVKRAFNSAEAHEENERCLFETGNLFIAVHRTTGDSFRIPFSEITEYARNPNDKTDVQFYQRTYDRRTLSGESKEVTEWYPVLERVEDNPKLPVRIGQHAVNRDYVIVDLRVNRPTSGVWGIADAFAAMAYAWAYSEYVKDASSLLKALTTIAWKVVNKSKTTSQQAGVRMANSKRVASTAVMTEGSDLVAMPRAGQVDMDDGRALAAMTASALGVPLVALTSDTSSASGSYGAVASLDGPTAASARARQEKWIAFYARLYRALGGKDLTLNFPTIVEDPTFRRVASLATARATGGLWADEYREALLETLNVIPNHGDAPDVIEYAGAANALGFIQSMQNLVDSSDAVNDPLARQGNSGVAGSLNALVSDNSARDQESRPGTSGAV